MQFNLKEMQAKAIAKAWKDPSFRQRLLKNPKQALWELGFHHLGDYQVRAEEVQEHKSWHMEDSKNRLTIYIPHAPHNAYQLSERELEKIAAAGLGQKEFPFKQFPNKPQKPNDRQSRW